jgi:hypothetical protein
VRVRASRLLLLTGIAGVVLAHVIDYLAVFQNGRARAHELQVTGHSYWPAALLLAAVAGAAMLALALVRGVRSGLFGAAPVAGPLGPGRLASCQMLLFVVIESAERAAVGVSPTVLLHSPEFWLGLALQVVVAGAVVMVLRGAEGVARRLAGALRRVAPLPSRARSWSLPAAAPVFAAWVAHVDPRGPPLVART